MYDIKLFFYIIIYCLVFFRIKFFFGRALNKHNWPHIVSMSVWCIGSDACQMLVCEALGSLHIQGLIGIR